MAKKRTVYRDSENGKFAKKSTWQRSKSQGGTRYKRQHVKAPSPPAKPEPPIIADDFDEWEEWAITFSYGDDE